MELQAGSQARPPQAAVTGGDTPCPQTIAFHPMLTRGYFTKLVETWNSKITLVPKNFKILGQAFILLVKIPTSYIRVLGFNFWLQLLTPVSC